MRSCLFTALLLGSTVCTGDWPRFRGADGNGSWNPPDLPKDLSRLKPHLVWKKTIGGGFGGVTAADGRIYVMDRLKESEEQERVLCFDAAKGAPLWQHAYPVRYESLDYGNGPRASVTIHQGRAYAFGAMGVLGCLDAKAGRVLWQRNLVKENGAVVPTWGFAASPFIWKETLFIHCGAKPRGSVLALDPATGAERWRTGDDPAGYCTPVVIEQQGAPQLIQWGPENIAAFSPLDGKELWRVPYKITYGVSIAQPVFHEGIVLVSGYWHGARAIRPGSPSSEAVLEWTEEKKLCGLMSQPLYRDGVAYLLTKSHGLVAFRLRDGAVLWSDGHRLTPKENNPQMSLVWADQKTGIACGLNAVGELIFARFSEKGFEELHRSTIIGKTWAHPAFTDKMVFARSDTELVAWRLWD